MQTEQELQPVWKIRIVCIVKRIVAIVVIIAMILGIIRGLRYVLIDDTMSYTRLTLHEFYEQDHIDELFVGASHCYNGFNPAIFDERLGENTYNLGSPLQLMNVSYTLIQEAVERYDVKHVYLELSYTVSNKKVWARSASLTGIYSIADYLKPSIRKVQLLTNASTTEDYVNDFLPARRNWDKLFDLEYIAEILQKKSTEEYKNYAPVYNYVAKGHISKDTQAEENSFFTGRSFAPVSEDDFSEEWEENLLRIIDYCKKKNVELTLLTAPFTTYRIAGFGNYDKYIEKINEVIDGSGIKFYDFNLCREEYFPDTASLFFDNTHLNKYGAEIFSNLVIDLLTGEITEEELFYDSCEEKLASLKPNVYGLSYETITDPETNKKVKRVKIVSDRYEGMEYQIQITPDGGETYTVQDFNEEQYFEIPSKKHGTCTINYRMVDDPENVGEVNIAF